MNHDEPFLQRWSRLKREGADKPAEPDAPADGEVRPSEPEPDHVPSAEPLDLSKLPRLEDLTSHTDMRAFLDPRVPADLQTAALRRAWRLDPVIDTFVEVAENQYDWNTPGGAPGFGTLVAGADLPQLLAQATGKLLEPSPDKPLSTVAVADDIASPPVSGAPANNPVAASHREPPLLVDPPSDQPNNSMEVGVDSQSESPPDTLQRRRHGAALPR